MKLFAKILTVKCWFSILCLVGCSSSQSQEKSTTEVQNDKPNKNISLTSEQEKLSDHFCTVKVDYMSFDFPGDRNFTWIINGHHLKVDSVNQEFEVKTYEGLDTVYFVKPGRKINEVMLCDLSKGERYEISYNTCCSDFNFWKEDRTGRDTRSVDFHLIGKSIAKQLIGGVGFEAAYLSADKHVTLNGDFMRSPMFPNRCQIFVEEFVPWHEDSTIARIIDPVTKNEIGPFKDADKKVVDFQYIFVDNDKLIIKVESKRLSVN